MTNCLLDFFCIFVAILWYIVYKHESEQGEVDVIRLNRELAGKVRSIFHQTSAYIFFWRENMLQRQFALSIVNTLCCKIDSDVTKPERGHPE